MSDEMSKQFFLELAGIPGLGDGKKGPRRVATPEGAQYYGQPIGTIITADMIEAKRQENKAKGVKPQKGMLTSGGSPAAPSGGSKSSPSDSSSSGSSSSAPSGPGSAATVNPVGGNVHTQKSYQAPGVDSTPTPEWMQAQEAAKNAPTPQMALGLGESSLNGPKKFTVGDTSYSAPEGSRLIRSKSGNPFAVVITPDKQLHFFTDKGEVEADETIKQVLAERFGDKVASEDTLYTEEEFDGQQDSLDKFVAGQKLYNAAGEEIFTKTQDGWTHSALGIPVEDKDIQPLFESGELTGSKPLNEEEIDSFDWGDDDDVEISFGSMSEDEFLQYASTLDEGDELYYYRIPTSETPNEKGLNEEGPQEYVTVISDGLGKFTLKHAPSTVLTNEQAVYIRSALMTMKPKDANEFGTWNAEIKAQEEKNKPAPEPTPEPAPKPADPVEKVADAAILESEAQQAEEEEVLSYENKFTDAQKQMAQDELQAGEFVGNAFALMYAPAGTTIISLDGEVFTAQFSEEEVYWTDLDGKTYDPHALMDYLGTEDAYDAKVVLNPANGPQQVWPDYALSKNQVGEAPKPDYLEEAPHGTVITNTSIGNQFYKNAVGWVRKSDPGVPVPIKHIKSLVSQNLMKIDEPQSGKVKIGALLGTDIDFDDFNEISMPGTVVVGYSEGNEKKSFTLNDLGYWNSPDVDEDGLLEEFETLPFAQYAFYVSTHIEGLTYEELLPKNGSPGEKPTVQWLEQSPVGSKFSISYTSKTDGQVSKAVLVKTDDNNWLPEDIVGTDSEDIFGADAESFQAALDKEDAAYVYQIEEIGNGTPPSFILSTKEGKSEFKDQGQIATFQNLVDSTNGTMFKYNKLDGTQSTYVKVNEDFILAPGGTFLRTKHWKKALDDGKVEFATSTLLYVQPDGTLSPKPVVDVPEVQNVDNPPEPTVEPTGDDAKDSEAFKDFVEGLEEWELELLNAGGSSESSGGTKSELFYDAQVGDRWVVSTKDGSPVPSGTYELVMSDGMDAASDLWVFVNEDGALNDYVSFLGPDIYEEAKSLKKVGTLDIEDLVTGANEGDAFEFEGKADSTIPNGVYVSTITDDGDGLQFFVYSNPDGSLDYDYAYGAGDLLEGANSLKPVVLLNITDDDLDSVVSPTKIFNSEFGASAEDIYEAIDVIENHPHASPVYGFKKVPNTNALKGHEDQIIADAKALYPKAAPKAAVLSYLKSMAGEPEPTVDTTLSIQIGAEKPAKNAFGVTGGTFTEKEISDALKILKAYGGKQFKSKLTQAGNPLGSLDFNSLVGKADAGDGGKLAQKQKVIDFLSEKYNAAFNLPDEGEPFPTNLPAPGEVQIEEYGEGWDVYNYEWVGDLDEMTTMLSDLFMSLPRYSKIQINPPGTPSEEYSAMKKLANGPEGWGGYLTIAAEDEGGELDVDGIAEKFVDAGYDKFYVFQPPTWNDPSLEPASLEDVNAMPVGAKVLMRSAENEPLTLQKGEDGKWSVEGKKSYYPGHHVAKRALDGHVWFVSVPPSSTWIASTGPVGDFDTFKTLQIGTVVEVTNKEGDQKQFLKVKADHWEPYNEGTPNVVGSYPDKTFETLDPQYVYVPNLYLTGALATPAAADKADEDGNGPGVPDEHSFAPGQYDNPMNGPAFYESVFVFGDGTGYLNAGGGMSPLTAQEVQTYPLNNWNYEGTSNPTPQPEPAPAKPKKAPASIGLADLPNGIYYLGNPNNSNTPTWKAKDGVVTEHLSDGTVKDVTATRLKNAVLKGKLVNKFGNSAFIPEGFEGSVSLLNTPTEIETLRKFRLALEKQDHLTPFELNLFGQKYGVFMSEPELKNLVLLKTGSVAEASNTIKTVKDAIDNMLGSPADYDTPDTGNVAEKYFEHVPGAPVNVFYLPEDVASSDLYMTPSWNLIGIPVAEFRAKITKLADSFAGGGIIGQHVNKMSKYDLRAWVEALQVGNFKEMYALESKAAAKGKVSHNSGWKHPGYIDNSSTQSVAWGPVVPGEAPAGSVPDGNWSSPDLVLTSVGLDEIHNYMLAAGMTNGHYLNPSDRRAWVSYHRAGNSYQTNRLSGRAIALKKMGTPPWDPEFTWTDNVVPAKSYSSKFDKDPYPVNEWGNTNPDADAAQAYLEDLKDGNVELLDPFGKPLDIDYAEPFYNKASQDNPHFSGNKISLVAVRSMFQALRDWKNQEESKPIYSMAPTQNIKKSLHPIYNVNDQFGNKYVFKVAPNDVNSAKYRAEVEAGANAIALALGTKAPQAEVMEFNGKLGVMQKFSESEGTFSNFDMKSITPKQAGQLAHEHIADWMLDQDDNWGPNTLIDPNGDLVGIDKGRAFAAYGSWKGLVDDSSMDVNTHLVYSDFYQAIIKKQISKEVADAAWLEANRRALKISKMDKGYLAELLHKATDSRTTWAVPYKIDGKTVPQTQEGFFEAFFDRQDKLPEQVRALWEGIYKKAGYGDLPEPPKAVLGEGQHSGLDDANFHETVMTVGSSGSSTLLADPSILEGHAISWTKNDAAGNKNAYLHFQVDDTKQEEILNWFKANTDPSVSLSSTPPEPKHKFSFDNVWPTYLSAAKTINTHATDGGYNAGTISNYEAAKAKVQKDIDFWAPDLAPATGQEDIQFPSGASIPVGHLGQYKMMLDHYKAQQDILDIAYVSKTTTAQDIVKYNAVDLPEVGVMYLSKDSQLVKTNVADTWIYTSPDGVKMVNEAEASTIFGTPGWAKHQDEKNTATVKYNATLRPKTHDTEGVYVDGVLTDTNNEYSYGMHGKEFEAILPTGEQIYFRNASATGTKSLKQRGRISVVIPGAKTSQDYSAGLDRAREWIETNLGLDLGAATDEDAELIYWREMYDILAKRKVKSGTPWGKAKDDLQTKVSQINSSLDTFLSDFAKVESVQAQNEFFRNLWGAHFGADKVNKLISEKKFLPEYQALDPHFPEALQGHPIWYRFDVDLEQLKSAGHMIASKAYSSDDVLAVAKSGAALSTEERMRVLGKFLSKGSSEGDQPKGGSEAIFTRIYKDHQKSGISFIYHPRAMLRTSSLSYPGDAWGAISAKNTVDADPMQGWINNQTSVTGLSGPELDLTYHSSLFGDLEVLIFDNIQQLQEAIQYLKKIGITEIRGVPIEMRLVMRQDLAAAIEALKKLWYNT